MADARTKRIIDALSKEALARYATHDPKGQKKAIEVMLTGVRKLLAKARVKATVKLGGSAAKETYLGDDFDIDIFVMFDLKKYKDADISSILKKALAPLKPVLLHGSRDYVQIQKRYEVIPVLHIKSSKELVNVTDASPLHADWVNKKLKKHKSIGDEIKKAKLFFKACGVYGAESYIKGLSGHVTDILVIHYGSFIKLIESIAKWKAPVEVDIEKHKTVLDKNKLGSLLVIDPIQPNRNAAAALSTESFEKLIVSAKAFLKKPTLDHFIPRLLTIDELSSKHTIVLSADVPSGKLDIVGARLMKVHEYIGMKLKEFDVMQSSWQWDRKKECYFCYTLKTTELSSTYERSGPTKDNPIACNQFRNVFPQAVMRDGKMFASVQRQVTTIAAALEALAKDPYFKEKGILFHRV